MSVLKLCCGLFSNFTVDTTRWSNSEQQIREKVDNDWKLDISDEESEAIVDVDWVKIPYNRQKNLVSPIVVEIMSDKSSSLNVPRAFEQPQNMQSEGVTFYNSLYIRKLIKRE